jgi:diguanylate cyclase (GGDEF)-like protein
MMKTGESEEALSLVMIDVDRLKQVNDTLGHSPGDRVLEELAKLLRKALRPDDIAARFGGDEYIVLLRHCDVKNATDIFCRFATRVKKDLTDLTDGQIEVTISCGIAGNGELPAGSRIMEGLIELADQRLYSSKNAGRNRVTGS